VICPVFGIDLRSTNFCMPVIQENKQSGVVVRELSRKTAEVERSVMSEETFELLIPETDLWF